jgi:hypothetical protein
MGHQCGSRTILVWHRTVISQDPEVLYALGALSDRLRVKGKDDLAEKLENLFELHEAELKAKSRKQS